jgi:hypothetical protein
LDVSCIALADPSIHHIEYLSKPSEFQVFYPSMNKPALFCFLIEASTEVHKLWAYIEFYITQFTSYGI